MLFTIEDRILIKNYRLDKNMTRYKEYQILNQYCQLLFIKRVIYPVKSTYIKCDS